MLCEIRKNSTQNTVNLPMKQGLSAKQISITAGECMQKQKRYYDSLISSSAFPFYITSLFCEIIYLKHYTGMI